MTVVNTPGSAVFAGNGVTTVFPLPFKLLDAAHLVVRTQDAQGAISAPLALDIDYSVQNVGSATAQLTMATAPALGTGVSCETDVPIEQGRTYTEGEKFPAKSHEAALDKLTLIAQQLKTQTDRALKVDSFSSDPGAFDVEAAIAVAENMAGVQAVAGSIGDVNALAPEIQNIKDAGAAATAAAASTAQDAQATAADRVATGEDVITADAARVAAQQAEAGAAAVLGSGRVPVGTMMAWPGATPPNQYWLLIDQPNQTFSRTMFPQLLDVLAPEMTILTTTGSTSVGGTFGGHVTVGAAIEASGIPAGATVTAINGPNLITISVAATSTGGRTARIFPHGNGDGSTTAGLPNIVGRYMAAWDKDSAVNPDAAVLGGTLADAMQRITGSTGPFLLSAGAASAASGAMSVVATHVTAEGGSNARSGFRTDFDSANSPGARTADRTRPMTYVSAYIIKVADGVDDPAIIQAAAYVTELNRLTSEVDSLTRGVSGHVTNVSEVVIDLSPYLDGDIGVFELDITRYRSVTADEPLLAQFSTDGGISWITSYSGHGLYSVGTTPFAADATNTFAWVAPGASGSTYGSGRGTLQCSSGFCELSVLSNAVSSVPQKVQYNLSSKVDGVSVNAIRLYANSGNTADMIYSFRKIKRP